MKYGAYGRFAKMPIILLCGVTGPITCHHVSLAQPLEKITSTVRRLLGLTRPLVSTVTAIHRASERERSRHCCEPPNGMQNLSKYDEQHAPNDREKSRAITDDVESV